MFHVRTTAPASGAVAISSVSSAEDDVVPARNQDVGDLHRLLERLDGLFTIPAFRQNHGPLMMLNRCHGIAANHNGLAWLGQQKSTASRRYPGQGKEIHS